MNNYADAWDLLAKAIGAAQGKSSGTVMNLEGLTVDQQLKVAEVTALLSISQELSIIHYEGIAPFEDHKEK